MPFDIIEKILFDLSIRDVVNLSRVSKKLYIEASYVIDNHFNKIDLRSSKGLGLITDNLLKITEDGLVNKTIFSRWTSFPIQVQFFLTKPSLNGVCLTKFKYLSIPYNKCPSLIMFTSLRYLDISHNTVTTRISENLINLEFLNISYCRLEDFSPLSKLPKLHTLHAKNTNIKNKDLIYLTGVSHELDLGWNDITCLRPLHSVKRLNLKCSSIQSIYDLGTTYLNLSNCINLTSIPPLSQVVYLNLSSTRIKTLPEFRDSDSRSFPKLKYLDISNTFITHVNRKMFRELIRLNISYCSEIQRDIISMLSYRSFCEEIYDYE